VLGAFFVLFQCHWLLALLHLAQSGDDEAIALLHETSTPGAEYSAFVIAHILPYLLQASDVAKY
jgi:hypothetical protein